ncbi:MAG: ABC-F family ATP-binding cassette domain-containing protein [Solirubrobacteraceae bacterium]|nr:ABC-F family ATP-binding cassette domain-containing protein [Solirubrobacteraceae bacterium]
MAVLIASDLAKDISGTPLLRGVSLKLERRDRLTIAGRNGAGKTTLLRMLAGQTSVDGGELVFAKGTKIALHDQRPPRDRDITLREYVQSANKELIAQEARLTELEHAMADGDEKIFDEYARLQTAFDAAGGYTWRERATQTIHGLGFTDESLDRQLSTFSGGQLTRASLARALAGTPDLLLLDEPTNHLDIESLEWLEKTLLDLDAAIILVAHDRWFLETVGTAVLEVEAGKTRFFPGTWAQWRREAAARELALGRAIDKQQKEIERMEKFVERFRAKATKAKQAQSRVKALDKIERIERDPRDGEGLAFQFAKPERTGRVIFELEDGKVTIGDRTLIEHGELWLERGEHVTVVGANGTGKTTLIETLAGERELAGGKLRSGHNIKVGYLSQHGDTLGQGGARTVLEATIKQTGLTPGKARSLLGRFLFSGEDAEKELTGLSGGERQRVSLAILVSSGANVLILDEPTNHLDLESREALEDALSGYEGAVLLITHDRALLDAVGSRTIALEDQRLHSYMGGWAEYVRVREERKAAPTPKAKAKAAEPKPKADKTKPVAANGNGHSKNARKRVQQAEREIEQAEQKLATVEEELASPDAWATPSQTEKSTARHNAAKREVEEAYARLEAAEA